MSTFILGIRGASAPSWDDVRGAIDSAVDAKGSRERLFGEASLIAACLADEDPRGVVVCSDGIIMPRHLDALLPAVACDGALLRELVQDDMRMLLKKHGITARMVSGHVEVNHDQECGGDPSVFLRVLMDDDSDELVSSLHEFLLDGWSSIMKQEERCWVMGDLLISGISSVAGGQYSVHLSHGTPDTMSSFSAPCPLYGDALRVEGMGESLQEFWHLTYMLGGMGVVMKIKRIEDDADSLMKVSAQTSYIRAA